MGIKQKNNSQYLKNDDISKELINNFNVDDGKGQDMVPISDDSYHSLNDITQNDFLKELQRIQNFLNDDSLSLSEDEEKKIKEDLKIIIDAVNEDVLFVGDVSVDDVVDGSVGDVSVDDVVDGSVGDVSVDDVVDGSVGDVSVDDVVDGSVGDVSVDDVVDGSVGDVSVDDVVDGSVGDVSVDDVVDGSVGDVSVDDVVDGSVGDVSVDDVVDGSVGDVSVDDVVDGSVGDVSVDDVVDGSVGDVSVDDVVDGSVGDVSVDDVVDGSVGDVSVDDVVDGSVGDVSVDDVVDGSVGDVSVDDVVDGSDFKKIGSLIDDNSQEIVIKVKNVTMEYKITKEKIDTIKEFVIRTIKNNKVKSTKFTALKNVSFEIPKGDRVGIIGFNGAGKSTLLKILSGVYYPTQGSIEIKGKLAPLLELGAGFDNNYSGKANIFLNGAFLGFSEDFLKEKYDEILEFSELGESINYPVKNYSSGMRAKLGFSIATLVEPDILIIDEILSVGDIKFQRKSANKLRTLIDSGITVLLVSHSIGQIRDICNKAIWLDNGEVKMMGEVNTVCDAYIKSAENATNEQLKNINLK